MNSVLGSTLFGENKTHKYLGEASKQAGKANQRHVLEACLVTMALQNVRGGTHSCPITMSPFSRIVDPSTLFTERASLKKFNSSIPFEGPLKMSK